jgi:hypothetical protein
MEINVNRGLEKDRQSEHTPASKGELYAAIYSRGKVWALVTHDDREKDSDPACGENVQRAGKRVTARGLSTPRSRSQLLKSMKNRAHPQPAREDRENTGDEAWNERLKKMQAVHRADAIVIDIAGFRQQSKLQPKRISARLFQAKRSMRLVAVVAISEKLRRQCEFGFPNSGLEVVSGNATIFLPRPECAGRPCRRRP